jgi:8-oxo-dGTP diphosphatase
MVDSPESYDPSKYDRPSVTVDVVIFTLQEGELRVLLIQRGHWPFEGYWAIPGGFVEMDESLEEAARRELREETGVSEVLLEQLYAFGDPGRDPRTRVISVAYFSVVSADRLEPCAGTDAADVRWWSMSALPRRLAFDHDKILACALSRLRHKLRYTAVAFEILPKEFTLAELQAAYETILGEKLDKASFRKKLARAEVVDPTGRYRETGGRPAELYRYRADAAAEFKARRLCPWPG